MIEKLLLNYNTYHFRSVIISRLLNATIIFALTYDYNMYFINIVCTSQKQVATTKHFTFGKHGRYFVLNPFK